MVWFFREMEKHNCQVQYKYNQGYYTVLFLQVIMCSSPPLCSNQLKEIFETRITLSASKNERPPEMTTLFRNEQFMLDKNDRTKSLKFCYLFGIRKIQQWFSLNLFLLHCIFHQSGKFSSLSLDHFFKHKTLYFLSSYPTHIILYRGFGGHPNGHHIST